MVNLFSVCKATKKKNKLSLYSIVLALFFVTVFSYNTSHAREMTEFPRVKLQSLDKGTARTMTFDAKVGSTLRFGPLYMRVQSCQKSSPIDKPEAAAFLQIWEVDTDDEAQWVFSGWMFASSPGLSPMDHPIYDVWVLDCLDYDKTKAEKEAPEKESEQGEGEPAPEDGGLNKTDNPNDADNQDLLEE